MTPAWPQGDASASLGRTSHPSLCTWYSDNPEQALALGNRNRSINLHFVSQEAWGVGTAAGPRARPTPWSFLHPPAAFHTARAHTLQASLFNREQLRGTILPWFMFHTPPWASAKVSTPRAISSKPIIKPQRPLWLGTESRESLDHFRDQLTWPATPRWL